MAARPPQPHLTSPVCPETWVPALPTPDLQEAQQPGRPRPGGSLLAAGPGPQRTQALLPPRQGRTGIPWVSWPSAPKFLWRHRPLGNPTRFRHAFPGERT